MKTVFISACMGATLFLSACATMERGTRDTFIVYTSPIAATVTTDMAMENSKDKKGEDSYFGCAPTPCSIDMPRKSGFNVLVSKEGYLPQSYQIESLRYNEMAKRNAQAVVGTTVAAGAVIGASVLTIDAILVGLGTATTGVAGAAVATTMLPVAAAGVVALGVDASSGANKDFFPNPMSIKLVKQTAPEELGASAQFIENFDAKRRRHSTPGNSKPKRPQP